MIGKDPSELFCELDRSTADREATAIFTAEFLVWWHQAGRVFYGWGCEFEDEGLIHMAEGAVSALGGWRAARRTLESAWSDRGVIS